MSTKNVSILSVVFLLFVIVPALAAPRAALLREAKGAVKVGQKPAKKFQALKVGDKLELAAGASIKVDFLKSGLRQGATGPGVLTVGPNGLKGTAKLSSDPKARMAAMDKIGAQNKMGGITLRNTVGPPDLRVLLTQSASGPTFKIMAGQQPHTEEYYALVSQPDDFDFAWEQEDLSGSELRLPESLLKQLEPGLTYTVLVGRPEQFKDNGGHQLRFQYLPEAELTALTEARRVLTAEARAQKDGAPLVFLMLLLDDNDMVEAAAEAGHEALTLGGLPSDERQLVAEAVIRLFLEADDAERALDVQANYLD